MMNSSIVARNIVRRNVLRIWSTVCHERVASTFCRSGYFIRHNTPISDPFHSTSTSFITGHSNSFLPSSSSINGLLSSLSLNRNVMALVTVATMLITLGYTIESTQAQSTPSLTTITSKHSLRVKLEQ